MRHNILVSITPVHILSPRFSLILFLFGIMQPAVKISRWPHTTNTQKLIPLQEADTHPIKISNIYYVVQCQSIECNYLNSDTTTQYIHIETILIDKYFSNTKALFVFDCARAVIDFVTILYVCYTHSCFTEKSKWK